MKEQICDCCGMRSKNYLINFRLRGRNVCHTCYDEAVRRIKKAIHFDQLLRADGVLKEDFCAVCGEPLLYTTMQYTPCKEAGHLELLRKREFIIVTEMGKESIHLCYPCACALAPQAEKAVEDFFKENWHPW
jgi:hypothetical protein